MSVIGLPQLYATLTPQKITGVTGTTLTIPGGYVAPYVIISKNGSILLPTDYTASNGTSVTLNTAAVSTDEFGVYAFGLFNVANPQFVDSGFALVGSSDATKKVAFEVDGLATGTTATITFGSGAPSASAAKGSLYIRTDGSSTSTRMYINTDGATAWTNLVTAA